MAKRLTIPDDSEQFIEPSEDEESMLDDIVDRMERNRRSWFDVNSAIRDCPVNWESGTLREQLPLNKCDSELKCLFR